MTDDADVADCPSCEGQSYELGTLGRQGHYRCRECGYTFPGGTPKVTGLLGPPERDPRPPSRKKRFT